MVDLSTTCLLLGKVTGSVISVPIIGSRNCSGADANRSSSSKCFTDALYKPPKQFQQNPTNIYKTKINPMINWRWKWFHDMNYT